MDEWIILYESKGGYTKSHVRVEAQSPEKAAEQAMEKNPTWKVGGSLWAVRLSELTRVYVETTTSITT